MFGYTFGLASSQSPSQSVMLSMSASTQVPPLPPVLVVPPPAPPCAPVPADAVLLAVDGGV
jgi:hypothetical protein